MDRLMIQGRVCRDERKSVGRRKVPRAHRGTEESLESEETEGLGAGLREAGSPECHQQLLQMNIREIGPILLTS